LPSLAPPASPHTLADEFLSSPSGHVDGSVTDPLNDGFYEKSDQFHSIDGARDLCRLKERLMCIACFSVHLFFTGDTVHTVPMDELEEVRKLVGPEAEAWTKGQLEQLSRDIEVLAEILLDAYRFRKADLSARACGSPNFDVHQPDR
jgi:hypothetical protein